MLIAAISITLTIAGAYFFFLAGMHYVSAHTTGALIPARNAMLKTGILGAVTFVAAHILYFVT